MELHNESKGIAIFIHFFFLIIRRFIRITFQQKWYYCRRRYGNESDETQKDAQVGASRWEEVRDGEKEGGVRSGNGDSCACRVRSGYGGEKPLETASDGETRWGTRKVGGFRSRETWNVDY